LDITIPQSYLPEAAASLQAGAQRCWRASLQPAGSLFWCNVLRKPDPPDRTAVFVLLVLNAYLVQRFPRVHPSGLALCFVRGDQSCFGGTDDGLKMASFCA
jgi:hypothetical protein